MQDDDNTEVRYQNGVDTVSILSTDGSCGLDERDLLFQNLLKRLDTDTERFVCLALEHGFRMNEVAYVLNCHPSTITRVYQKATQRLQGLAVVDAIRNAKN